MTVENNMSARLAPEMVPHVADWTEEDIARWNEERALEWANAIGAPLVPIAGDGQETANRWAGYTVHTAPDGTLDVRPITPGPDGPDNQGE